jgi:uncharacterized protein YcbX
MARRRIGTVKALWRYPVKSMRGEALDRALVSERGIAGDRAWAVIDASYGGAISARAFPRMLEARAFWEGDPVADAAARVQIETPDGRLHLAGGAAAADAIAAMLKREVRFERIRTAPLSPAEREAIMRGAAPLPSRDFFDEDVLHLLATGTLAHLRRLEPAADFDPRRFRPNILVETAPDAEGFVEDGWLEGTIEIGAAVRIAGARPALRCAMTIWPQDELPHRPETLRAAWEHHQAYVGLFAAVAAGGTIRCGDQVALAD